MSPSSVLIGSDGRRADQSRPRRLDLEQQLGRPLREFLNAEAGSARLLLGAVLVALLCASSPLSAECRSLWTTGVSLRVGDAELAMDLRHWVNDGLMFLFLLVVDIAVRRELPAQDELEFEDLLGYAGDVGLDVERFTRELELCVHASRVLEDVASAEASGARATPTFFVGDCRHVGPHDAAALEASRSRPGPDREWV